MQATASSPDADGAAAVVPPAVTLPPATLPVTTTPAAARRWPRRLAGAALAVLVLLAAGEAALRIGLGGAMFTPRVFEPNDGVARYRLAAGVHTSVRQFGRTVTVSTDAEGHRVTPGFVAAAGTPLRVHLVGDSQVFGWGLSDDETLPARLQRQLGPGVQVVNHGVPGFGPTDYLGTLAALPANEPVVVVHTEENDTWDAYRIFRNAHATCGYVTTFSADASALRCTWMNLRLVQLGAELWDRSQRSEHPTPLGFSALSTVAATVLNQRIATGYADERRRRDADLIFAVVPWKGRIDAQWRAHSLPSPLPDVATLDSPFPDATQATRLLAAGGGAQPLYLDGDSHLSPAGAIRLALLLKPLVDARLAAHTPIHAPPDTLPRQPITPPPRQPQP
jgi:hypothetical protein